MVVHNFHVKGIFAFPSEADAPLIVDAYAVLPGPVSPKRFKVIAGRDAQIVKVYGDLELIKFSKRRFGTGLELSALPAQARHER